MNNKEGILKEKIASDLTNLGIEDIKKTYSLLAHDKETEIRLIDPHGKSPALSKFVKSEKEFLEICAQFNGKYNIYAGINERGNNGTSAKDVISVRTIVVDIDALHPKDLAATEEEIRTAEEVALKIKADMIKDGFSNPSMMMSGNGFQLWFATPKIDVSDSNRDILEKKLQKLQKFFIENYRGQIKIDNIGDLPRIIKVSGTLSIKGNNSLDRPFRLAKWVDYQGRKEDSKLRDKILMLQTEEPRIVVQQKLERIPEEKLNEILSKDEKLKNLLEDKDLSFPSRSEADMSAVCKLLFYDFPREQIFEIMNRRSKWMEGSQQYQELTYKNAAEKYLKEEANPKYINYVKKIDGKSFFQYELLVEDILRKDRYATDMKSEMLYIYSSGVWSREIVLPVLRLRCAFLTEQKLSKHQFTELVYHLQNTTFLRKGEKFDTNPYLINCKNGVYDLQIEKFREHSAEDYLTAQIPVTYEPTAKCEKFEAFIKQITGGLEDALTIQKLFGYFLVKHSKEQKFFIWEGDGANGKGKLLAVALGLLGRENCVALTLTQIEKDRFSKARLYQKLANLCGDLSYEELELLGTIKRLTGEDSVSAEKKGEDGFDFDNYAKAVFLANRIPKIEEDTGGVWRRIVLLNFPHKFEKGKLCPVCNIEHEVDKDLLEKLLTELPGILNWAIAGYKLLQLEPFKPVEREMYLKKSDPLKLFAEEMIVANPDGKPLKTSVYASYVKYCRELSMPPREYNKFWMEIQKHRNLDIRKRTDLDGKPRAWYGVELVSPNKVDQVFQGFRPLLYTQKTNEEDSDNSGE